MSTRDTAPAGAARREVEDSLPPGLSETERHAREIHRLAAQNDRLLQSMDSLLRQHESAQTQRQVLQATLDRLIDQFGLSTETRAPEALAEEIRQGVSADLRPLLHAIIDLMELSMGPLSPNPEPTPEAKPTVPRVASANGRESRAGEGTATQPMPADDLPRALPEILTKPVEELVAKSGARRPSGRGETNAPGRKAGVPTNGPRAGAWIPVTSGPART